MPSKSRRPYLIRAIYDWSTDNGFTPHLLVAADAEGVIVPRQFVQDGKITLNISPAAVQALQLDAEPIWFSARFGGRAFDVQVPSGAVLAIFARENGEGIMFGEVEAPADGSSPDPGPAGPAHPADPADPKGSKKPTGRPKLRIVK